MHVGRGCHFSSWESRVFSSISPQCQSLILLETSVGGAWGLQAFSSRTLGTSMLGRQSVRVCACCVVLLNGPTSSVVGAELIAAGEVHGMAVVGECRTPAAPALSRL